MISEGKQISDMYNKLPELTKKKITQRDVKSR